MKRSYQEPEAAKIIPVPLQIKETDNLIYSLDGIWDFKPGGNEDFDITEELEANGYQKIELPYDITFYPENGMQQVKTLLYKKKFHLPLDFKKKDCILRFEGVNGFAKVWVNGKYAGEHQNAFLTWNLNITDYLNGEEEELFVLVDEKADKVSTFNHGGIVHSVQVIAVPEVHITSFQVGTDLDEEYKNARMDIQYSVVPSKKCRIKWYLTDSREELVKDSVMEIEPEMKIGKVSKQIKSPLLWDAEHPNLYTLHMELYQGRELIEKVKRVFGFRKIKIKGNQMFINGKEVKLRGVCRHEIAPFTGRYVTKEMIEEDMRLFKEANCNYIRTSHYPPNEYLLEVCDRGGMYVEDEMALAFIARSIDYTQRDPACTERYLSHFSELYGRDFSHPSVVIWSLCNESFGGYNFDILNRYVHKLDPSRPTKFSYPMTMAEEHEKINIWSVHYPNYDSDLAKKADNVSVGYTPGYDMPVLHDEYAHIPCYNRTEHRRDPGVRNFWGESIKRFWDNIWNTKGALGGAIWAGIDETNIYKGGNTCLEWGIIDVFRRKKPEFYLTRKAYSPVVIREKSVQKQSDNSFEIKIENRFCHTNMREISIRWKYGALSGERCGPDIAPGQNGTFKINPQILSAGEKLELVFMDGRNNRIDEYELETQQNIRQLPIFCSSAPHLFETENSYQVKGREFSIEFSKRTGLITEGKAGDKIVIKSGPFLHVPYLSLEEWRLISIKAKQSDRIAQIQIKVSYGKEIEVSFEHNIDEQGLIQTSYCIDKFTARLPRSIKLRVGVDCGGLDELGVTYQLSSDVDTLAWKSRGLWTTYPSDHIGRNEGICSRTNKGRDPRFGDVPTIPFSKDSKSYLLNGKYDVSFKGTNDFRSMKQHIYEAEIYGEQDGAGVELLSDGRHSVRLEIAENPDTMIEAHDSQITYYGDWYQKEDKQGGYSHTEMWSRTKGDYAVCKFYGTGVVWYGPADIPYGHAKVYLDGNLIDPCIDQRVNGVDFPGSAAGTDKKYHLPLFMAEGLNDGEHELKIEVKGEHSEDAADSYIVIESLKILPVNLKEDVNLHLLNAYNYPHLAWGNYMNGKIEIKEGYKNEGYLRLKTFKSATPSDKPEA